MIKRLPALLLAFALCLTALADSVLDEYIETYNYFAAENGAPLADASLIERGEDGWYIGFADGSYTLGVAFDEDGLTDLIMLECALGMENAKLAFINAWYVSDADLEYSGIVSVVNSLLGSGSSAATMYGGWYVAYEYINAEQSGTGTPMEYIGVVWVGDDSNGSSGESPAAEASPSPSPSPSPDVKDSGKKETKDGKPVYKA